MTSGFIHDEERKQTWKDTKHCVSDFMERECKRKGELLIGKYKIRLSGEDNYHVMEVNEVGEEIAYIGCIILPVGRFHFPEDTFNMIYASIPWKERLNIRDLMNRPLEQRKLTEA